MGNESIRRARRLDPHQTERPVFPLLPSLAFKPSPQKTPAGGGRPSTGRRTAAEAPGTGMAHTGSASGTSKNDPERSRSTSEDQGRGALARQRGTAAALPGAERAARTAPPPKEGSEREASATSRDPKSRVETGFRTPAFPTSPKGAEERRGARWQNEKRRSIRHERLSLAWRGFGPAQESAESPHRSAREEGDAQGAGEDPARTGFRPRSPLLRPRQPRPQGERPTTQNTRTPDTRLGAMETSVVTHRPRCPQRGAHGG